MAVTRLNHAVLWVRDAERTASFFEQHLGFVRKNSFDGAVFLQTSADASNDHDLGVFSVGADAAASPAGQGGAVGMYHLAWEVATLGELLELRATMAGAGALAGESDHGTSKSLYCKDPDGLEFELMWAVPEELMSPDDPTKTAPIDWDETVARFGADTAGRTTYAPPVGTGPASPA